MAKYPDASLIFGGDFNAVFDPPSSLNVSNGYLKDFMEKFDVIYIFRQKFPTLKLFTWNSKHLSKMSRIDYWWFPINLTTPIQM